MISSLPLSRSNLILLHEHKFETREEIYALTPSQLARELEINQDEALKIWKTAKFGDDCMTRSVSNLSSTNSKREVSALNLWRRKARQRPIFSLCEDMDKMFGNGIRIGEVTEFCGVPGAGKTQLGMQIACTVQIPTDLHGPGGQAIYIDTEGSFMPRRAYEIAGGVCKHLRGVAAISSDEKVKLIILDSIAFHFRHGFEDNYMERNRTLTSIAQTLTKLAQSLQIAVIIMNHVTARMSASGSGSLTPALGPTWAHSCTNRVMLEYRDGRRWARILKSSSCEAKTIEYEIGSDGVRNLSPAPASTAGFGNENMDFKETSSTSSKRQRML
eukprot:83143-Amorphochlora_amoeboformis.AAC.2